MPKITEIQAYKTTNGELFLDRELAEQCQEAVDRATKIHNWVEEHCCYDMSKQDISNALIEDGDELGI